ncbi:sentrin-specific protease [Coprinopsis cinerea okayama7|uniref:Sentrin-specific protease n=1 Tax=Coprinopsis cinerea (strain Okayama-7 / 130 / ATCC MYA-4618 / FGSC 9003) TaxID=240176 RepID=A8N0L3_COPC7|nr:sentrin-specific protease [Coprinopsis cinerea okayama7\|eukprot:XP_001828463.2 sentrin-specific protease [Coprinopsis cinerea okayama7\
MYPPNRKYKLKPHIKEREHKARVRETNAQMWKEFRDREYAKHTSRSHYDGSKLEFTRWLDYILQVRDTYRKQGVNLPGDDLEFIQQYLEKYRKTMAAPLPKTYTPNLEQLDVRRRLRDSELEAATRPKLPTALPPDDEAELSRFLNTPGQVSKCAREAVTAADLRRLNPGQWLNDEVINFYGAMINQRAENGKAKVKRGKVLNAYYFSTFFWTKLTKEGYEKGRLAKWTKKVDIFSKDIVLIPVNHSNSHWTAAAINFKLKRFESYDSLDMAGEEVCQTLRGYVQAEHMNKKKKPFDFSGWENYVAEDNPKQQNGYDCGVFTCQTLESLSRGENTLIFTQKDMPYLRKRMLWEIGKARFRDD